MFIMYISRRSVVYEDSRMFRPQTILLEEQSFLSLVYIGSETLIEEYLNLSSWSEGLKELDILPI